jgi:hypothetical protein
MCEMQGLQHPGLMSGTAACHPCPAVLDLILTETKSRQSERSERLVFVEWKQSGSMELGVSPPIIFHSSYPQTTVIGMI